MKKLMNWIAGWGEKDKWIHATICLLVALTTAVITKHYTTDKYMITCFAWFAGFVAGVAKEIYDDLKSNGSDSADWAADVIGDTVATIYVFLLVA